MQFVSADKETQTRMLRDPHVARAILQTLAENPQSAGGGGVPQMQAGGFSQMGAMLGQSVGIPPAPGAVAPGAASSTAPSAGGAPPRAGPQWSGAINLARNMGKRIATRSTLLHGRVQDVEVALRSAAGNSGLLDITHRVPFEEVARRAPGTILCLMPPSPMEQPMFEEYVKYFRSKMRAGVARLDGALALYVLPPVEDVPALRDALYTPYPDVPRAGCLLGLIAPGTTAAPPAPKAKAEAAAPSQPKGKNAKGAEASPLPAIAGSAPDKENTPAASSKPDPPLPASAAAAEAPTLERKAPVEVSKAAAVPALTEEASPGAAADEDAGDDGGDGGLNVSSKELLDLFSNPELIKLLSDEPNDES